MTNIVPVIDVFPQAFQAEERADMLVAVTNSNPSSDARLNEGDSFQFTFSAPWGLTVRRTTEVLVFSPSTTLDPVDFSMAQSNSDTIVIQYISRPKPFPAGEAFGFACEFWAPSGPSFGMVIAQGPNDKGTDERRRFDLIAPVYTTIAFMTLSVGPEGPVGPKGDQGSKGDQGPVGPKGDQGFVGPKGDQGAGGSKGDQGPQGMAGPPGPAGPVGQSVEGPNFLQIAARKWHEVAEVQRIDLPNSDAWLRIRPAAMAFDGEYVWIACVGADGLVRLQPHSSEVTVVKYSSASLSPSVRRNWGDSLVYDSEKFWLSGGLVVLPDGTTVLNLPEHVANPLLFDGRRVWGTDHRGLIAIDAKASPSLSAIATGIDNIGRLAFDGARIWLTRQKSDGSWQLVSLGLEASNGAQSGASHDLSFVPTAITFDGNHIWLGGLNIPDGSSVIKYDLGGNEIGRYVIGNPPLTITEMLFDGASLWLASVPAGTITKVRPSDGSLLGSFRLWNPNFGVMVMAFDGINVWVAADNSLFRL